MVIPIVKGMTLVTIVLFILAGCTESEDIQQGDLKDAQEKFLEDNLRVLGSAVADAAKDPAFRETLYSGVAT